MGDLVNRVLGRSVVDLAGEVDAALGRLASAQHQHAQCVESLAQATALVEQARADVDEARDALFREHPDLAPKGWGTPANANQEQPMSSIDPGPGLDPSKFDPEPVIVDDANDPRFTGGASPIPTGDDAPLPPIEWEEHDA